MLGVIIVFFAAIFDEISNLVVKVKLEQKRISVFSLGVINEFATTLFFVGVNIFKNEFIFSFSSLPTLSLRIAAEIILYYFAMAAIAKADRSTHGFIRTLSMPLILIVDFFLGYQINFYQLSGIAIIIISLFLIFFRQGINKRGAGLSLITAVLAVLTISLYKYDITNFNSVAAEQAIVSSSLLIFLTFLAIFKAKDNPLKFFKKKIYCFQSFIRLITAIGLSYAYAFAPASVIVSAIRSSSTFWSVITGKFYFHEKHFLVKVMFLALLVAGIILLTISS